MQHTQDKVLDHISIKFLFILHLKAISTKKLFQDLKVFQQ